MTTPVEPSTPTPPSDPGSDDGSSVSLGVVVVLAFAAAVVFWAGLSLGGQTIGRNDAERTAIEAFTETYQQIADEFVGEADPGTLLEAAICGMFETLDDPYSICMGPDEFEARFEDVSGEFGGIGAVMNTQDASGAGCETIGDDCGLVVIEVLSDTPALAAGLLADDRITAADGVSLDGFTIDDSVLAIRGPEGSDVVLTLERDGREQELTITRDLIVTEDVRAATLADGRVGYIRIDSFSANAADDFEDELRAHLDAGVEGIVLDLRDDPGGFVDAAVDVTSQFIAEGPVFWEEDASGEQFSVDVVGGGLATDDEEVRLVVLVDGGSASASELVAGALQDAGRAQLVGERTFGKGSVQEWTELPGESGGFRLSVARWLTRDKRFIEGTGLTPDVVIENEGGAYRPIGGADPDSDTQLAYAIALLLDEPVPGAGPASATSTASPMPDASASPAASDPAPSGEASP